jgi:hypothetical protein
MKKKLTSRSAFFNGRMLISLAFCAIGVLIALIAFALYPGATARAQGPQQNQPSAQPPLLTPEEARTMANGLRPLVNDSTDGLVQVRHASGAVSLDLEGRFQDVILARKDANGKVTNGCVNNPEAAAAFLQIDPRLLGATTRSPAVSSQPPEEWPDR